MTEIAEKRTQVEGSPQFSAAEITRALTEVAACSGNTHMAARNLQADENATEISQQTLWRWSRREKLQEYERIRAEALPTITAEAAEEHMNLARLQADYAREAASLIADRLPRMEDKDLVNAMGKLDIGSGIHTEKAQLLSGQPTSRPAGDLISLLKDIKSLGGDPAVVLDLPVESEEDVQPRDSGLVADRSA